MSEIGGKAEAQTNLPAEPATESEEEKPRSVQLLASAHISAHDDSYSSDLKEIKPVLASGRKPDNLEGDAVGGNSDAGAGSTHRQRPQPLTVSTLLDEDGLVA